MTFFRNAFSKLYQAVSAPVAATRDALAGRLQSVRETAALLYKKAKERLGYGEALRANVEDAAREEEEYAGLGDIKHLFRSEKNQEADGKDVQFLFDQNDM